MGIVASVQSYDLNIPAGGAQNIDVAGTRVQFLSADDPFAQIELRPNYAQGNISLRPGQGFQFDEQVTRWVVFNRGGVPLKGLLLIGSGNFFDQRIAGTVDVIDGGKARTLAGIAFTAYGYSLAQAAVYSALQLWNPVGSGKNAVVEQILIYGSNAAPIYAVVKSGQTVYGNLKSAGQPKKLGSVPSVVEVRGDYTATPPGLPGMVTLSAPSPSGMSIYRPNEPIVVPPGWGLNMISTSPNVDTSGSFEWYEDPA